MRRTIALVIATAAIAAGIAASGGGVFHPNTTCSSSISCLSDNSWLACPGSEAGHASPNPDGGLTGT